MLTPTILLMLIHDAVFLTSSSINTKFLIHPPTGIQPTLERFSNGISFAPLELVCARRRVHVLEDADIFHKTVWRCVWFVAFSLLMTGRRTTSDDVRTYEQTVFVRNIHYRI